MKIALITGITGQDGSYLAELLLEKNYMIYGIMRRSSSINTKRIDHIFDKLKLYYGDLTDSISITKIINIIVNNHPDDIIEIYNLGAQSHVKVSFDIPEYTFDVDGKGVLVFLEIIKNLNLIDRIKFYQASTSELYGKALEIPQNENTPFNPQSPYGVAKLYAYWIAKNYRNAYGIFACNGILFNHESSRRGETFVTKKIINGLIKIKNNPNENFILELGNINSLRDWGHAKDYVYGMWLMLQQNSPDDFVLATGLQYSVKTFIEKVCLKLNLNIKWEGSGTNETCINLDTNKQIIKINPKYFRPTDVDSLLGDYSKAKKILDWEPKYDLDSIIDEMISN